MKTPGHIDWTVIEEQDGFAFRWGYSGEDLIAEWKGILSLRATRSGELKALQPVPGAPVDLVEKTRLGVATAFLHAQRHQHALHASAVALRGKALLCIGASGLGKSTMADRMCRRSGVELLADDTAVVEFLPRFGLQVPPTEPAVWLVPQGFTAKTPAQPSRVAERPATLVCIVSLVFDAAARVHELREIRGVEAVSALLPALVRFEKTSALWERELEFIGHLCAGSRVVQARRSREVAPDTLAAELARLLEEETR
jgi:hypothetical protein